jgi:hypothetical protein
MGWTVEGSGFESRWGKDFLLSTAFIPDLGSIEPPIQPVALSAGVKRKGLEADHSPLFSAEVKSISTPPYVFMACVEHY